MTRPSFFFFVLEFGSVEGRVVWKGLILKLGRCGQLWSTL